MLIAEEAFRRNRDELEARGVIFCDVATGLSEKGEMVGPYLARLMSQADNSTSAGSFMYIPPGVEVENPIQANPQNKAERMSQFDRTLILADEGSKIHLIEGCSAPVYTSNSKRSSIVEIVVKPGAHVSHTTIQNWSSNVSNTETKRAFVEAEGQIQWIDANIGSRQTKTAPAVWLTGPKATSESFSVTYAGPGQHQDTGATIVHEASETSSKIVSKSISTGGGRSTYRPTVRVVDGAVSCKSRAQCDALVLDDKSTYEAFPETEIGTSAAQVRHDETVSAIAADHVFYLMSRGLSYDQATGMLINGFIEPVARKLPMEYAVELSRLVELQMEGSVG